MRGRFLALFEVDGRMQSSRPSVNIHARRSTSPCCESLAGISFPGPSLCFPDTSEGISALFDIFGLGISAPQRGRNLPINSRRLPAAIPFSLSILHTHPTGQPLRIDTDQ